MDTAHVNTFFTPTTCFTIACAAFSIVALTSVWRSQQQTSHLKTKEEAPRPKPVRRRAVDSLFVDQDRDSSAIDDGGESASKILIELISLSASACDSLGAPSDGWSAGGPSSACAQLSGELSQLTTNLCRLQQQVLQSHERETSFTFLCSTLAGLRDILRLLQIALRDPSLRTDTALTFALQQLRDQRPAMDFLLESTKAQAMPPTPPCEADVQVSLKEFPSGGAGLLPPTPAPTGLTPGGDTKTWIEPPPEYSPPSASSDIFILDDKKQEPTAAPTLSMNPSSISNGTSDLLTAITKNDISTLNNLLAAGSDPNLTTGESARTALHHAAHLNISTAIPPLLRAGALLTCEDSAGDTPLHLAAASGHVEALTAMLTYHYTNASSPSSAATSAQEIVDYLNREGHTPLFVTTLTWNIQVAKLLLLHGANPNIASLTTTSTRPLHQAAISGSDKLCSLLLSHGAAIDAVDEEGNTALHYAATSGPVSCVQTLLRAGADVTIKQQQGLTCVHWAAHKGHVEVLSLLLEWWEEGAEVPAEEGATALHLAANRGHEGCVRVLLERGVRKDSAGVWDGVEGTAGEMAKAKGHTRVAKLLGVK